MNDFWTQLVFKSKDEQDQCGHADLVYHLGQIIAKKYINGNRGICGQVNRINVGA